MKGKRILIVDDQKFAARLLRDLLVPHGFVVDEAYDGLAAFHFAVKSPPDLILLDLMMPGIDGVETCRKLKREPKTASVPVIVVTAKREKEYLIDAFRVGADDYLCKPVFDHELLARVRANLARSEAVSLLERPNAVKNEALSLLEKKVRNSEVLLEISQAATSTFDSAEILRIVVMKIADHLHVHRCSFARIDEENGYAVVLASSDAPGVEGLRIDLNRYPEIREAARTGKPVVIEEAKNHPLLREVREEIRRLDFNSLMVLPVIYRSEVIGTLMLRAAGEKAFSSEEVDFCGLAANISARALKNADLFERVMDGNRRLKEIDRLKSDFVRTATHEFSTPVTVLHGYLDLIRDEGEDNLTPRQREYLAIALESSDRMVDLIDDMLDLAKLEAGKVAYEILRRDVRDPVEKVFAILAPYAGESGLTVRIEHPEEAYFAYFDNQRIERVVMNLVGNAIKYTAPGGDIAISFRRVEAEVHVSVCDTGEGIPAAYLTEIFDEFTQVKRDSVRKGAGLGLAICKKIVEAHNGRIWVHSSENEGSCFSFSLPAGHL
jgi:signal transduction histidine kinase/DNA-binding response OmpR family regulator